MYKLHFRISYSFKNLERRRQGRTLKGKEQYVKGKATKICRKDAFRHCKHRKFSADVIMVVFMLEMFKSSQYDFDA